MGGPLGFLWCDQVSRNASIGVQGTAVNLFPSSFLPLSGLSLFGAPHELLTTRSKFSRMSRAGSRGSRSRSSMALMAAAPMLEHGWWIVVRGTESRLAYLTS